MALPISTARRTCGTMSAMRRSHLVVDDAARFAAQDRDERAARRRFLQNGICRIHQALRPHPLLEETFPAEFVIRHEVRNADDLPGPERRQGRHRVASRMRLVVELHVVGIDAESIMGGAGLADGVLGEKAAGLAAEKHADLGENLGPQRGVQRRIVDMADEPRQHRFVTLIARRRRQGDAADCRSGLQSVQSAHRYQALLVIGALHTGSTTERPSPGVDFSLRRA